MDFSECLTELGARKGRMFRVPVCDGTSHGTVDVDGKSMCGQIGNDAEFDPFVRLKIMAGQTSIDGFDISGFLSSKGHGAIDHIVEIKFPLVVELQLERMSIGTVVIIIGIQAQKRFPIQVGTGETFYVEADSKTSGKVGQFCMKRYSSGAKTSIVVTGFVCEGHIPSSCVNVCSFRCVFPRINGSGGLGYCNGKDENKKDGKSIH